MEELIRTLFKWNRKAFCEKSRMKVLYALHVQLGSGGILPHLLPGLTSPVTRAEESKGRYLSNLLMSG